jgi:hypothetical protein
MDLIKWYGSLPGEPIFNSAFPSGKQAVFIISRGDPEPPPLMPQLYDYLNKWLQLIPMALGTEKHEIFSREWMTI